MFKAKAKNAVESWWCFWGCALIGTAATLLVCLAMVQSGMSSAGGPTEALTVTRLVQAEEPVITAEPAVLDEGLVETAALPVRVIGTEELDEQLAWAERESLLRLENQFAPIDEVFRKARCRQFAEVALDLNAKWQWVQQLFSGQRDHAAFIEQQFRRYVLDDDELERVTAQCVTAFEQELNSIDGALLVRLQIDAAELPGTKIAAGNWKGLRSASDAAIKEAIYASFEDIPATIAQAVIADQFADKVMGIGEFVGLISDETPGLFTFFARMGLEAAAEKAMTDARDPIGQLTARVEGHLTSIRERVLEGDQSNPGILKRLSDEARKRTALRRQAIDTLLSSSAASVTLVAFP